jgi:hypothetical protein
MGVVESRMQFSIRKVMSVKGIAVTPESAAGTGGPTSAAAVFTGITNTWRILAGKAAAQRNSRLIHVAASRNRRHSVFSDEAKRKVSICFT